MDLVEFIGVIRKWKWLVLAVIVVVTAYVLATNIRSQNNYSSDATVVAGLSQMASTSTLGLAIAASGDRISATYSELVTAQPVMEKALDRAGLDWPTSRLESMVSSSLTKNTPVLRISVVDTDPNRAVLLTNAVADSFVEYIRSVSTSGIEDAENLVLGQLSDVDRRLADASAAPQVDNVLVKTLQDQHDNLLKEYQGLLDQQAHASDVRVVDPAYNSYLVGTPFTQRVAFGFVISVVAGIVVAFLAEAVQKSLRGTRQEMS